MKKSYNTSIPVLTFKITFQIYWVLFVYSSWSRSSRRNSVRHMISIFFDDVILFLHLDHDSSSWLFFGDELSSFRASWSFVLFVPSTRGYRFLGYLYNHSFGINANTWKSSDIVFIFNFVMRANWSRWLKICLLRYTSNLRLRSHTNMYTVYEGEIQGTWRLAYYFENTANMSVWIYWTFRLNMISKLNLCMTIIFIFKIDIWNFCIPNFRISLRHSKFDFSLHWKISNS